MSPIVSPAGVHSASEHVSTGRALNWVTSGQPLTHGATCQVVASSLPWATGGHVVERVGSDVAASFISLGRELGGETAQDFTDRHPSSGFDWLRHGQHHGEADEREAAKNREGRARVRT